MPQSSGTSPINQELIDQFQQDWIRWGIYGPPKKVRVCQEGQQITNKKEASASPIVCPTTLQGQSLPILLAVHLSKPNAKEELDKDPKAITRPLEVGLRGVWALS
jgi:hypothetical protein